MKKILLLATLVMMAVAQATGQNAVGDWRIHTSYVGNNVTAVADTREWVYYLAGGNLFRLDKETAENEALSIMNDLSDMLISQLYYNTGRNYVVVVYSNANIDVIQADGSVVNMPEIKDAVMTSGKTINDVTFADGVMYVATDFGYVVIDDHKFVVKESHIYREKLTSVARVGDKLLISTPTAFYYGDAEAYHEQLSSFTLVPQLSEAKMVPIDNANFFYITGWTYVAHMTQRDDGTSRFGFDRLAVNKATQVQSTAGGWLLNLPGQGESFITNAAGQVVDTLKVPGEIVSSHPDAGGTYWAAGPKGLHTLGSDSYYLPNSVTFATPFWMTYNKSSDLLYVSSPGPNAFFSDEKATYINTYDGMKWQDVTPEGAPTSGSYWIEFMPDDASTYFLGTWRKGLLKVVDGKIAMTYDESNSPLLKRYAMHPITSIDRNGNLWVVQSLENPEHPVMVLPAAKTKLATTTAQDWILPEIKDMSTGHTQRACFLSTRHSNYDIKIFTDGDFKMPIVLWNSNGGLSTNPDYRSYSRLTDQDGQAVSWTNVMTLEEDLNGLVWMGTTEGIVSFNPAQAFSSDFRVNHIKVPRNDGTGMADYLLDGIQVNDIAVDGANRKWIATQTSGLFLVSADGSQVIARFNTTNSPLASNTVYQVCCNQGSNSVYVTTPAGLYEYFSDSSPAEPNYDNIYAYPNPVRPEYGGNVTITGMMEGTLVKIADASGNVIRQLKSTGGMATWDCCDQSGERVPTGVYMVLCSQSASNGKAAVTKIAVIN